MPNLDGTGPFGQGKMTGRRRGHCRDKQTAQTEKSKKQFVENNESVYEIARRGRTRGGGRRRGWGGGN